LLERLEEERKQLIKLKLTHAVSPLENPNKIKVYRKTIARLETEAAKRRRAEAVKNIEQLKK
jgi:large subunit ribosomal protein L29